MNSFIKVPNALFDFEKIGKKTVRNYPLKPIDLFVYLYLLASSFENDSLKRKVKTIAERCNVKDNKTIHSSINHLEKMGLVARTNRFNRIGFKISSSYSVTKLSGDFFILDRRYLNFNIGTSAFCILVYLIRCSNNGFACPSLSKIANATGISRPTIRRKTTELQQHLYLSKVHILSKYGDHSNNNYFIKPHEIREKLLSIYRRIKPKISTKVKRFFIAKKPSIIKCLASFFSNIGWVNNSPSLPKPT